MENKVRTFCSFDLPTLYVVKLLFANFQINFAIQLYMYVYAIIIIFLS